MTMTKRWLLLAGVAVAVIVTGATGTARSSAAAVRQKPVPSATGKTLGFVATYFFRANSDAPDNCPNGKTERFDEEGYLKSKFPSAEVERLLKPENSDERARLINLRGPNGEDVCRAPWAVPDPMMKTGQSNIVPGLDLDDGGKNACKHEEFTAPWGDTGIDNQLGRIFGCVEGYNEQGFTSGEVVYDMETGEFTVLVEITGVDDVRNDDDVTVTVYSGADPAVQSIDGKILRDASYWVHPNKLYHNSWKGRIKTGVVTTVGTRDFRVKYSALHGGPESRGVYLSDARFRFEIKEDGTAEGFVGGYRDLDELMNGHVSHSQLHYWWTCPDMYYAFKKYADGYPDPKTGECTMISAAWRIRAVPAWIIHPAEKEYSERGGVGFPGEGASTYTSRNRGPADAVTGKWTMAVSLPTGTVNYECDLQQGPPPQRKDIYNPSEAYYSDLRKQFELKNKKSTAAAPTNKPAAAPPAAAQGQRSTPPGPVDVDENIDPLTTRAACGVNKATTTFVPVRRHKDSPDHLAWEYQVDGNRVQVDAKLISGVTMLGKVRVNDAASDVRIRRAGGKDFSGHPFKAQK